MSRKSKHQPRWSLWLIRQCCKQELIEEMEGNLLQYLSEVQVNGSTFAILRYWYQVVSYIRPSTLKSFKYFKSGSMFYFNPVITFRNLLRHKGTALLNLLGFSIGLVATIFLYFYTSGELNHDSFHEDSGNIYRAKRQSEINGEKYEIGVTSGPYAEALKLDFPGIITNTTRVAHQNGLVSHKNKKFQEDNIIFADSDFFTFFSFPLVSGNPKTVLGTGKNVVISKDMAQKYFGSQNPIGKILEVDNEYQFTVSGIFDDFPSKSSIQFDMVFSIDVFERFSWFSNWWSNGLNTFVKINTREEALRVESQLPGFMDKYMGDSFAQTGRRIELKLEPFNDIYFNHLTRYDTLSHGSYQSTSLLVLVAIAILFIACFNYVNLSISHSFVRSKEISVRKVLGVQKVRLVLQFLGESAVILISSLLISIALSELLRPGFNYFFDLNIEFDWSDSNVLVFLLIMAGAVLLTAGLYPALLMSSYKPIEVLKGSKTTSGKSILVRKTLVTAQFAISAFMIVATIFISKQTNFMNSKELGFAKEAILLIDLNNSEIRTNRQTLIDRLNANPAISGASVMTGEPGGFHDTSVIEISGLDENLIVRTVFTDSEYLKTFGIEIKYGRDFSKDLVTDDSTAMILNEKALADLGLSAEEALGRTVEVPSWNLPAFRIVGIATDFHFSSLKDPIEPLAIMTGGGSGKVAVKVNTEDLRGTITMIEDTFSELSPNFPISYTFLDDQLASLYENETKQTRIFGTFSAISILLASIGIFGLAAYASQQRQKEMGIRKILGATPAQIIQLISEDFTKAVSIAILIAVPVAGYFLNHWLSNFAYRINLLENWYFFGLGGLITIVVSLITVTINTYRAAISNPTESIRNE